MSSTLFERCKAIFHHPHLWGLLTDKLNLDKVFSFEMLKHSGSHFGCHCVILNDLTRIDPYFAVHFDVSQIVGVIFFLAPGAKDMNLLACVRPWRVLEAYQALLQACWH